MKVSKLASKIEKRRKGLCRKETIPRNRLLTGLDTNLKTGLKIGVKSLTLYLSSYSFRIYFINILRQNGVDIAIIKNFAGHRDIRTTEIYRNVLEEEKVRAIESIRI